MYVILYYDFGEKRVAKALKICRKYLTHVQNSVFEGEVTQANYKKLVTELRKKMDEEYDSLIIYTFESMRYSNREVYGNRKNEPSIMI
jgi:CRISPR-associated protein Cas2